MRRLIMTIIILGLVTGNIAWAADFDELNTTTDSSSLISPDHHDTQSQTDCDHCCHGSAHLIGLLPITSIKQVQKSSKYSAVKFIAHITQTYQPPTPPPNA